MVEPGDALNEGSRAPAELLDLHAKAGKGSTETELYLVGEVQKVYKSQGVDIHDKHIELIVRQMLKKVRVMEAGDTSLLPGELADKTKLERENTKLKKKDEAATFEPLILGITKASLATESFLSAASFQETTKVLTDASIEGKVDHLLGLKENVIIGKLIPAATGLKRYRQIGIGPSDSVPAHLYARPETEAELLAALEEIGGDGDGLDLEALGLTFGGQPSPETAVRTRRARTTPARRPRFPRSTRRSTKTRRAERQIDERGRPRGRPRRFRRAPRGQRCVCSKPARLAVSRDDSSGGRRLRRRIRPAAAADRPRPTSCGLPDAKPLWIDYGTPELISRLRPPRRDRRRLRRRLSDEGAGRRARRPSTGTCT